MTDSETALLKGPTSHEDKDQAGDLYRKYIVFMIFFAVVYLVTIVSKICRIKKNNGSKLVYLLSIIFLTFRLFEILVNLLVKTDYNEACSVLLYWTIGFLMLISYTLLKTRYVKGGNEGGYANFSSDVNEARTYMKHNKKLVLGYAIWCLMICVLSMMMKIQQTAKYAFLGRSIVAIMTFFFIAVKYFGVSNNEELTEYIKKVMDILTTCLVVMGSVELVSAISLSTFIEYFVILKGGFYIAELILASQIARTITNERNVEFVEFNPVN